MELLSWQLLPFASIKWTTVALSLNPKWTTVALSLMFRISVIKNLYIFIHLLLCTGMLEQNLDNT
jgi:hypothetical protein